jgi:hypothetical protein
MMFVGGLHIFYRGVDKSRHVMVTLRILFTTVKKCEVPQMCKMYGINEG